LETKEQFKLTTLWPKTLCLRGPLVTLRVDLFAIFGDSVAATRLMARRADPVALSVEDVFLDPNPGRLVKVLRPFPNVGSPD
jgi:hypothetical protein